MHWTGEVPQTGLPPIIVWESSGAGDPEIRGRQRADWPDLTACRPGLAMHLLPQWG